MEFKRFCKKQFVRLCAVIFSILAISTSPLFILFFSFVYLYRSLISCVCKLRYPDVGKIITCRSNYYGADHIYSKEPHCNLILTMVLQGQVDFTKYRQSVLSQFVHAKNARGELAFPELQQYLFSFCGYKFWRQDSNFNIDHHVKLYESEEPNVFADELKRIQRGMIRQNFTRNKSCWEMIVINNYSAQINKFTSEEDSKSVVIFRVHHALADGYSLFKLISKTIVSFEDDRISKFKIRKKNFFDLFLFILKAPYELFFEIINSYDVNEWHNSSVKLSDKDSFAMSPKISIDYLKNIKNGYNVSLSALMYAGYVGGLRKLMMAKNVKIPRIIHAGTPLPLPGHPDKLRNYMSAAYLPFPVGEPNPIKRLLKIEKSLNQIKKSTIPIIFSTLLPLVGSLWTRCAKYLGKNRHSTLLISNFPGPSSQAVLTGNHKLLECHFGGGALLSNVVGGATFFSYQNDILIVAGGNQIILKNDEEVERLLSFIMEEFKILDKTFIV